MTYVNPYDNQDFWEQFCTTNLASHTDDLLDCTLVSAKDAGVCLETRSSNFLGRAVGVWRSFRGTSFETKDGAKWILAAANDTLHRISTPSTSTTKERIYSICKAASRTCLSIERLLTRDLEERKDDPELKRLQHELVGKGHEFLECGSRIMGCPRVTVACQNGTLQAALDLIKSGEPIRDAVGYYTPLLKLAFERELFALCRQFIELGADPKAAFQDKVKECSTALLCDAIKENQEDVAIVLVGAGASLDIRESKDGKYPMHLAAKAGFKGLIDAMLNRGADVNCLDRQHNTPLHEAAKALKADVATILLKRGVDVAKRNHEIDERTTAIKQGVSALALPSLVSSRERGVADFYCKVLPEYNLSPEEVMQGGIRKYLDRYLDSSTETPKTLIKGPTGSNPFELALLFQDLPLAKKVVEDMPLSTFFEHLKKLKSKYPTSTLDLIEFCHLSISSEHYEKSLRFIEPHPPSREVKLDEILTLLDSVQGQIKINNRVIPAQELRQHLRSFIARVQHKADLPALMNQDPAKKNSFYELIEYCIKNCIIAFQDSPHNKEIQDKRVVFVREIVDLQMGEQCAGKYFGVCTKLFRDIHRSFAPSFEDAIYLLVAEHREMLLTQCVDPTKETNRNDYNYLLANLGPQFKIPGHEACAYYQDPLGKVDLERAKERFIELNTVASIVNDCVDPALQQSEELQQKFRDWVLSKMPADWGGALVQKVQTMMARPKTSAEQIREFLRKNGVSIEATGTNYIEAIEKARRQAYLDKEVYEEGKIRHFALCRMLAGLEKKVLASTKLGYEQSPTTFASYWLDDIIDMVEK